MSKDFDNIMKEINKNHKELYQVDSRVNKELESLNKDIGVIKKDIASIKIQIRDINHKMDTMLEILNNFTLMFLAEDDGVEDNEWTPYDNYGLDDYKDEDEDNI
jgi:seryl-tRNA synthetase